MTKGEARARMVATAAKLLAEQGPPGASFGDVLKSSGAARGSTYHHFPNGKRELYDAALELAYQQVYRVLEEVRGASPAVVIQTYFDMWRTVLTRSDLRSGCAILAVAVAGEDEANVRRTGALFGEFRSHMTTVLVEGGLNPTQAEALSATALTASEGAVAVARAEQSIQVFDLVATQVVELAELMTGAA